MSHPVDSRISPPGWLPSAGFALALAATLLVYGAAGASLGLAIGGFFIAAILSPALTCYCQARKNLIVGAAVAAGISLIWLALIGPAKATFFQWATIVLVLAGFSTALIGAVWFFRSFRLPHAGAAALTTLLALAWLTWPIWLSPPLARHGYSSLLALLVNLHPPLVANGVLVFTSPWTEQTIAYGLTVLDQDVPLRLPSNATACILAHFFFGVGLIGLSYCKKRLFDSPTAPPASLPPPL